LIQSGFTVVDLLALTALNFLLASGAVNFISYILPKIGVKRKACAMEILCTVMNAIFV
jgi:hypothetical protein